MAVVVSAATAALASPLLAGWSAALAGGVRSGWWRPRRVSTPRLLLVGLVAVAFAAAGVTTGPWVAWWVLAVAGAVLAVVDVEAHLLPSRLVYPVAALEAAVLSAAALTQDDPERLARAGMAAVVVGGAWFLLAFAAGGGIGLGDVRLAGVTGGLLGWLGWSQVLHGQLVMAVLAVLTAVLLIVARRQQRGRKMPVPLGPAFIGAALLIGLTA